MHVHGIRNPLQDKLDKKKQGEYTWLTSNKQLKEDGHTVLYTNSLT